ncbi:DUF2817 domain-containing protein [Methylobacter sp. S3L5C]|uniref:DUF2817 domain-containing protein n=1 Tax=Methylobacter sp. S3L5C TaxID=2839024 RepID=UPI001FACA1B5|nr:DUF2817 domain-containing protein [Methylobacter sp. S3L5C]UOA07669.1 M14 family metallopeptidase [Methylobacter sp. S3L5C]
MSCSLPFTAIDTSLFPANYASGRQRWLAELSNTMRCYSYPCAGSSPQGDALFTDTVWIGPETATKVVILIGGTHGVEGFAGSAIETDILRLLAGGQLVIPTDTALLMIHALTPWGYAWLRRCDADGVDLNRNVVDFSGPLPENSGYEILKPTLLLNDTQQRQRVFTEFAQTHGREALEKAISGGQYTDPAGPFYGGQAPAHGRLVIDDLLSKYFLQQRDLAVIDIHTGLGSFGYGEIICDHQPDSPAIKVARQWYGDSVTLPWLGTSSSVPKLGLLDYAWHAIMNERSCYITLEFGTYRTDQLFEVLLRDHQLWAQPGNALARQEHSQLMRQHFFPQDKAWQEMVLFRARQVINQALWGIST